MPDDNGDLRVRPAVLADRPALALLWAEIDALHARIVPGFFGPSAAARGEAALTTLALRRILAAGSSVLFVAERRREQDLLTPAEQNSTLAGCIRLDLYDTPDHPGMRPRRRAHVERIVVAHAERRHGVGRRLMTEAAAWARRRGASQLVLTVWSGNDDAERFYRALGYRTISQVLGQDL